MVITEKHQKSQTTAVAFRIIKIITLDEINSSELNWIKTTVDVREKPILFSSPRICPLVYTLMSLVYMILDVLKNCLIITYL